MAEERELNHEWIEYRLMGIADALYHHLYEDNEGTRPQSEEDHRAILNKTLTELDNFRYDLTPEIAPDDYKPEIKYVLKGANNDMQS